MPSENFLKMVQPEQQPVEVEARQLVGTRHAGGPRQNDYGHPLDDFTATAMMWTGLLLSKLKDGVQISAEDVALMMCALKLRRETHYHKRDSIVDGIGYLIALDELRQDREERTAPGRT